MKKILIFITIGFSIMLFQMATAEESKEKVRIQEVFGTRQIKDWQVIDNKHITIDTYSHGKFKATFAQSCPEISFTETIGFMTQGPYALDENTTIVLSNGEKCMIQELVPYTDKDVKK